MLPKKLKSRWCGSSGYEIIDENGDRIVDGLSEELAVAILSRYNAFEEQQTEIERLKNPVKLKIEPSVFTQLLNKIENQQALIEQLVEALKDAMAIHKDLSGNQWDAALAAAKKDIPV